MVVLDTNILIDHLRQKTSGTRLELLVERFEYSELSMSIVSIQELFAGLSSKAQEEKILRLLSGMKIWPYEEKTAKRAGEIERDEVKEIDFADAAIAATAIVNTCELATLNRKHFLGIGGLELVEV